MRIDYRVVWPRFKLFSVFFPVALWEGTFRYIHVRKGRFTMEAKEALTIVDVDPQISVHDFDDNILGNQIFFHVIKLRESFHICVGTAAVMKNLAVAMQTKYVSTSLLPVPLDLA